MFSEEKDLSIEVRGASGRRIMILEGPALDKKGALPPLSLGENWRLLWLWEQEADGVIANGLIWLPTAVS